MSVDERANQLLANVPIEDQLRGREIGDTVEDGVVIEKGAASFLGVAPSTAYRYVAEKRIGHIKLEGSARKGRGRSGAVRIRLIDCITFMVQNEILPGATAKPKARRAGGAS